MKKAIPKLIIFFYLIPLAVSVLFACVGALLVEVLYMDIPSYLEWLPEVVPTVKDLVSFFAIYSSFGIFAYYIFYEKAWKALVFTASSAVFIIAIYACHYLIYHIIASGTLFDINMYEIYYDNVTYVLTDLTYFAIFLFIALNIRAAFGLFLMKKPSNPRYTFSPKHPIGLAAIIFIVISIVSAILMFINTQIYTNEEILKFVIEFLIRFEQFAAIALGAAAARKWNGNAPEKKEKAKPSVQTKTE